MIKKIFLKIEKIENYKIFSFKKFSIFLKKFHKK